MSGGIGPNQNVSSPSFVAGQINPVPINVNQNIMPVVSQMNQNMIPVPANPPLSSNTQNVPNTSSQSISMVNSAQEKLIRLIGLLRERSKNLFITSGTNLDFNMQLDNFNKNLDKPPKLEKSLEDILAYCNQIELCLQTLLECAIQLRDSQNYLPFQVSNDLPYDSQQSMLDNNIKSYPHYINVIKREVSYAKSLYDILSESSKQIRQSTEYLSSMPQNALHYSQHPPPQPTQQLQPQTHSHQPTSAMLPNQMHP